ncbi:MAG: amidohydrolase family protein [Christensenellales bacterium]|nr:amidohydrolase family protein [Christensenellales bacterium]
MKTLIRNANVWQKGKFLTKDVLVDGERIAVVGKLPEETQCDHEVDGTGKFLLPGVIDCHAHSTMVCGTRHMPDFFASSDAELTLDGAINAEKMVRCGITTIRDCGGRRFETLAVRDYINKGKLIGPRMLCSGTPLKVVGGHEPGADYTGPWEARARVREFLMHGVDFLKVMVTGGLGKAGEDPGCVEPTQEELDAIVSEAKKHGKKVACHCHSRQGMEMLVKAGADSVEHSTYLDADVDKLLIENGVYVVPTFLPYMNYALLGEQEHQLMDTVLAARAIVDEKKRRFKEAFDLGVKVAFGRDSGGFMMDQGEFVQEMLYMEDAGMTPAQIIHAATEESAKLCGVFGETGSIDEGKSADMILLSASPLEDLRAFNTALLGVYMRGRYLGKREEAV